MTFRDITISNLKSNIRKYLSYFLCSSFCVMVFFMYSTLLYNDEIQSYSNTFNINIMFSISIIVIILFSVFFINYVLFSFLTSRKKEFGLYMTLGMTNRDIRKLVLVENSVILSASLIIGALAGSVFSRLFFMIVCDLIGLKDVKFYLDVRSFILTLTFFILIYTSVLLISWIKIKKQNVIDLLKSELKGTKPMKISLVPGLLAILLMILSFGVLMFITTNKLENNMWILIYTITCLSGVYLTLTYIGYMIINLIKKRENVYYKNILNISEISHRFNQNKNVIFILTILSAMIIFFVASPYSLLQQSFNIAESSNPNHIQFVETGNINKLKQEDLNNLFKDSNLKSQNEIEFIYLLMNNSGNPEIKSVISIDDYNLLNNTILELGEGEALNIITTWVPGYHGIPPQSRIVLTDNTNSYSFLIKDSFSATAISEEVFPTQSTIVLNNNDYKKIRNTISEKNKGFLKIFNFKDWQKTDRIVSGLKMALEKNNQNLANTTYSLSPKDFKLASTIQTYKNLKQIYSMFLFVTVFMGLLFFISSGSVLYFKQFSELLQTQKRIKKLYKIGITSKEIKNILSKELAVTFFTPFLFGSIIGYSYMYLIANIMDGNKVMKQFMIDSMVVTVIYLIFQCIFFLVTRRKFLKEILTSF